MIKILSWNIQQGGGSRTLAIVKALTASKASIIVLTEYRNNDNGCKIREKLLKSGYRFQFVTPSTTQENSVLIASLLPGNSILHPSSDPIYGNNVLEISFPAFSLIGGYFPHKKKHALFPFIKKLIESSDHPYIVAGDFNTGKNYVDQKGNSFWYQDELKQLEKVGMVDTFRLQYPDVLEYSWYSHGGNGYRYDQTYVSKVLIPLVSNCYYQHEWRENKLSDHSAMVLELG